MGAGVSGEFSALRRIYQKVTIILLFVGAGHALITFPYINLLWTYKGEINEEK